MLANYYKRIERGIPAAAHCRRPKMQTFKARVLSSADVAYNLSVTIPKNPYTGKVLDIYVLKASRK